MPDLGALLKDALGATTGPEVLTLYHGTTAAIADRLGNDHRNLLPGSWLTSSREWAEHYANLRAQATGDHPAVLEFKIRRTDLIQGGLHGPLVQEYLYLFRSG